MQTEQNPVMAFIRQQRNHWIGHTRDENIRLLIWRVTELSGSLMDGFFAMQQQFGDWNTPDLFIQLSTDFDTCFGYSRNLRKELLQSYRQPPSGQADPFEEVEHYDSAQGFLSLLAQFVKHMPQRIPFRYLAVALTPETLSERRSWDEWLQRALAGPISPSLRLVLVDSHEQREHQTLKDLYPERVEIIEVEEDILGVMRETAIQSRGQGEGSGATALYRQQLTDMMQVLNNGNATQAVNCGERALRLAKNNGWTDQATIIHLMVAGAFLKEQQYVQAIDRYRQAREAAVLTEREGNPAGKELAMQACISEAGAWLMSEQLEEAAQSYLEGVALARAIPSPIFVIDGLRMAAQCFTTAKQHEKAQTQLIQAVQFARGMSSEERCLTTLPFVFLELLKRQDRWRTDALESCAEQYQRDIAAIRQEAEEVALQQGWKLPPAQSLRIEEYMEQRMEQRFQQLHEQREQLIGKGGQTFQAIVASARQMLHPRWNGLPEVAHPLDHEPEQWQGMPDSMPLVSPEIPLEVWLEEQAASEGVT